MSNARYYKRHRSKEQKLHDDAYNAWYYKSRKIWKAEDEAKEKQKKIDEKLSRLNAERWRNQTRKIRNKNKNNGKEKKQKLSRQKRIS